MDERTFHTLDLEALIALLARHVQTPLGRKRVMALVPSTNRDRINRELDRTTEFVNYLSTGGFFLPSEIVYPRHCMALGSRPVNQTQPARNTTDSTATFVRNDVPAP